MSVNFTSVLKDVIPQVILTPKKRYLNVGLILSGYSTVDISLCHFVTHVQTDMIILKKKLVRGCMKDVVCEYRINRRKKLLCQICGDARCMNVMIYIRLNFLWSDVLELATKLNMAI
jgi:hypothetical protein